MTGQPARPPLYDVDADLVARLALACPSVVRLSAGSFGEAATHLVGRSVRGVRLSPQAVTVHVVGRLDTPVDRVAAELRAALRGVLGGRRLDVVLEDVVDPADEPEPDTVGPDALGSSPFAVQP